MTLLEVLVVIAIIAILTTMAVPVLRKGKAQGQDILCTNNIRQIGMALSIYTEGQARYPEGFCGDAFSCHPAMTIDESRKADISYTLDIRGYWWFCLLADVLEVDYADPDGIFRCPSRHITNAVTPNNLLLGNYGINYSICKMIKNISSPVDEFSGVPLRPDRLRLPASKLLVTDSGYALISWRALAADLSGFSFINQSLLDAYYLPGATVNPERVENGTIREGQQDDAVKGRHSSGKLNVLFADGHVDKTIPASIESIFDETGSVLNNSAWSP